MFAMPPVLVHAGAVPEAHKPLIEGNLPPGFGTPTKPI